MDAKDQEKLRADSQELLRRSRELIQRTAEILKAQKQKENQSKSDGEAPDNS